MNSSLTHSSQQMPEGSVDELLAKPGAALRVKFGMDPTAPDLHLGHMVILQRLRAFQDAGHTVVLIIGDFTARVGDPTGRSKTRPMLDAAQIAENAQTFCDQAFLVLDRERTELHFNSEWLDDLGADGMLRLLGQATVSQLLARKDFADRLDSGQPLSLVELVYPLLQGLDSVMVHSDIEAGGQDQLLNLLAGRDQQIVNDQPPQAVICWPLLVGLDGVKKMSKSLGNHVALIDDAANQFGQIMSISDELMAQWADLLMVPSARGSAFVDELAAGWHPMLAKRHLARTLVARLHDEREAARAEAAFVAVFKAHAIPDDAAQIAVDQIELNDSGRVFLPALLVSHLGAGSRSQARQTIKSGGFRIDDEVFNEALEIAPDDLRGRVLRVGRRNWLRVT
jgi:tyrosyl-tRNA synthetase